MNVTRRERELRGCCYVFGVRRAINKRNAGEPSEGGAVSKAVKEAEDTERFSQRVCLRPYGHDDGDHRGPRMNLMRPSVETWKRAKAAARTNGGDLAMSESEVMEMTTDEETAEKSPEDETPREDEKKKDEETQAP